MRIKMWGVVIAFLMAASAARADFKVAPGVLPEPPKPVLLVPSPAPVVAKPVVVTSPVAAPESKAPVRPPLPERKQPVWIVKPGSSLRAVVDEFTTRAGWVVEFSYKDEQTLEDRDLTLGGGLKVEGDFKTAIRAVFDSLSPNAKIDAELWSENSPPTLYIFRKGTGK